MMSNNDKFIRDSEFGKLMENKDAALLSCLKCKYWEFDDCYILTEKKCYGDKYYFAKDETDETKKGEENEQ